MTLHLCPEKVQVDHTGKTFGGLTVQQYAGHKGARSYWACQCLCGLALVVKFEDLAEGNVRSCGCNNRMHREQNQGWCGYGEISGVLYSKIRRGATRRDLVFNVDISDLWKLFVKQGRRCALTGWEIWFAPNSDSKHDTLRTASLDRIDSSKGYVKKNLRWVHKKCNVLKMSFSDKEFFELIRAIAKHKEIM